MPTRMGPGRRGPEGAVGASGGTLGWPGRVAVGVLHGDTPEVFLAESDAVLSRLLLRTSGYEVGARVLVTAVGIEIDREAVSPSGRIVWFEYKGSVQGSRPGLLRTDTLKKAIANGALLKAMADRPPFVVLTSHLPEAGAGLAM